MTTYKNEKACIRVDANNPDHHLYLNNRGCWWIHYRIYPDALTADRERRSLGTSCVKTARQKRDIILARLFPGYSTGSV